jgi:methionyl-tRNA formyltransferase
VPQDRSLVTKAPKLSRADGRIDWSQPAQEIHNLVRAMQPWPQARTTWRSRGTSGDAVELIVHATAIEPAVAESPPPGTVLEAQGHRLAVAAGQGSVVVLRTIQVPGRKPLPTPDFLRGCRIGPGDLLGGP